MKDSEQPRGQRKASLSWHRPFSPSFLLPVASHLTIVQIVRSIHGKLEYVAVPYVHPKVELDLHSSIKA